MKNDDQTRDETSGLGASPQADGDSGSGNAGAPVGDAPSSPDESSTIGDPSGTDTPQTPGEQQQD